MTNYRIGIAIVLATLTASTVICLATVDRSAQPRRAALNLTGVADPLGPFQFTERSGRAITDADLTNEVWVAAFIFTRCKSSCPVITARMRQLQDELADSNVRLVSISVDPEHDTPEVLTEFARGYGADPDRWWFLRGDKTATYKLIQKGFFLSVAEAGQPEIAEGSEAFIHSDRLAVVDRGNQLSGLFSSRDESEMAILIERARNLAHAAAAPEWARRLPAVNATLNGTCAVLLVLAWALVRGGRARAHAVAMTSALNVSALFLASYLVYHYQVGSVKFEGTGTSRVAYLSILLSHTILAVVMLPLIAITVIRAWRKRFDAHRKISSATFPIWLYVSVTGVVIYWMLYQIDWSAYGGA